jgi:DNA-binding transcriptional MerR regulator
VPATLRIGQLAEATGLTVRTLRHYEAVGLLGPVGRSESGYRRYRAEDAERLYTIVALRRLGLSLAQIRATLAAEPAGLKQMLACHTSDVRDRIASLGELEAVLERVQRVFDADDSPSLSDLCDLVRLTAQLPRRDLAEEPEAIRLLFEPLSGAVIERLHRGGPATAPALARALGKPVGAVRGQLEGLTAQGFVEEDGARSRPRARVWRVVAADLRLARVERTAESDRVARSWFEPSLRALAGSSTGTIPGWARRPSRTRPSRSRVRSSSGSARSTSPSSDAMRDPSRTRPMVPGRRRRSCSRSRSTRSRDGSPVHLRRPPRRPARHDYARLRARLPLQACEGGARRA